MAVGAEGDVQHLPRLPRKLPTNLPCGRIPFNQPSCLLVRTAPTERRLAVVREGDAVDLLPWRLEPADLAPRVGLPDHDFAVVATAASGVINLAGSSALPTVASEEHGAQRTVMLERVGLLARCGVPEVGRMGVVARE